MQQVRERYPQASMVEVGVALDAMNLVYEGRADAAVVPLVTARYYIVRLFRERLAIADLVPIGAATPTSPFAEATPNSSRFSTRPC